MLKTFTPEQLAGIVMQIINETYNSAEAILAAFNTKIKNEVKQLMPQELLPEETNKLMVSTARWVFDNRNLISSEGIIKTLSPALKNESYHPGIEISNYEEYLRELAKTWVGKLIDLHKKRIKAMRKGK